MNNIVSRREDSHWQVRNLSVRSIDSISVAAGCGANNNERKEL